MSQIVGMWVECGLKEHLFCIFCKSDRCFSHMPNLERKFVVQDLGLFKNQLSEKSWADLDLILALTLTSCVTLSKLLDLSKPQVSLL